MRRLVLAVLVLFAIGATAAQAGPLTIVNIGPGDAFNTPANNDIFDGNPLAGPQYGYAFADLRLDAGTWLLTYSYIGSEAGYTNTFGTASNAGLFSNKSTTAGMTFTQTVTLASPGYVDFRFRVNSGASTVVNGLNPSTEIGPNFFLAIVGNDAGNRLATGSSVYIALDDQGFTGDDDNHDDLVVRLDARAVPDGGATLALLGCGLVALGAARRRFLA